MNDHSPSRSIKVSLIPEISLVESEVESDAEIALVSEYGRFPIPAPSPAIVRAFRALSAGRSTETELAGMVLESAGIAELTKFNYWFAQCVLRCFVQYRVYDEAVPVMSLILTVPLRQFEIAELDRDMSYRISRFSYCHREENEIVMETPLFGAKLLLHDARSSALLPMLAKPHTVAEITKAALSLPGDCLEGALQLMKASRTLCACPSGMADEDANTALKQWEFHDLLFHSRSRIGRHNHRIGATFRHLGQISPQPLIKDQIIKSQVIKDQYEEVISLVPPAAGRSHNDMTLFDAVEARRSIRQHGKEAISAKQLSEFLYRVARIRALWDFEIKGPDGSLQETLQLSNRPYPAGGAIYELEMYLTIDRCKDLKPGLYRYLPLDHKLAKISAENAQTAALLKDACFAAGITERPQVLINLASRFQRMSWKYATISYAATLKNVGVLYQTMYLVATGMGLAACGLGSGNSDLFAEAAGTNYYMETSVGEFMLGTIPESEELPPWMDEKALRRNELLPAHD